MLIGNLPLDTTKEDLLDFFEKVGKVGHIELLTDKGGRCKGFAFVTMSDSKQQEQVISALDNSQFKGRVLSVSLAKTLPQPKRVGFLSKLFGAG
jgi:RNA recognition motif-containing protein